MVVRITMRVILCPESLFEREGSAMLGSPNGRLDKSRTELPRAAGGSINGTRVVMGILLVLIALAVILVLIISALGLHLSLPLGVVGHEGSTVLVSLNSLRLLSFN